MVVDVIDLEFKKLNFTRQYEAIRKRAGQIYYNENVQNFNVLMLCYNENY